MPRAPRLHANIAINMSEEVGFTMTWSELRQRAGKTPARRAHTQKHDVRTWAGTSCRSLPRIKHVTAVYILVIIFYPVDVHCFFL